MVGRHNPAMTVLGGRLAVADIHCSLPGASTARLPVTTARPSQLNYASGCCAKQNGSRWLSVNWPRWREPCRGAGLCQCVSTSITSRCSETLVKSAHHVWRSNSSGAISIASWRSEHASGWCHNRTTAGSAMCLHRDSRQSGERPDRHSQRQNQQTFIRVF
jgi:hypothetical protein